MVFFYLTKMTVSGIYWLGRVVFLIVDDAATSFAK